MYKLFCEHSKLIKQQNCQSNIKIYDFNFLKKSFISCRLLKWVFHVWMGFAINFEKLFHYFLCILFAILCRTRIMDYFDWCICLLTFLHHSLKVLHLFCVKFLNFKYFCFKFHRFCFILWICVFFASNFESLTQILPQFLNSVSNINIRHLFIQKLAS